ncbi:MAG TPA: HAD family hydrolase [Bacillota bacterium]|nr:HAD family hydrolase [Bacillota bacterium]
MAIVTVDFDGTLFKGNSFQAMFQTAKKDFTWKEWSVVGLGLVKAAGKGLTKGKEAFKHGFFMAFARSFRGKTKHELDTFFKELVQMARDDVNEELIDRIREHQKNGDTVIVLSGALHPFLEAFVDAVGLDVRIISTGLQFDHAGICTGEVDQIVNGQVKVDRVEQWIQMSAADGEMSPVPEIWAYADSLSDVPLLQFVNHPVVVNPKKDMLEAAEQYSWPIFPEIGQAN